MLEKNICHTFIVLAYKESPYLEECLQSLLNQTLKSNIIVATSTPSEYLEKICLQYSIQLRINLNAAKSISDDWNFAYQSAKSDFVTLAHQDDIYCKNYTKKILAGDVDFSIAFTDYYEIKGSNIVRLNLNLLIKRLLLFPFFFKSNISNSFIKKAVLAFGSPICCPSVTYNKKKIGDFNFNSDYGIDMDWLAWLELADIKANFKYIKQPVVCHRIHDESETSNGLQDNRRQSEDLAVFQQIWGKRLGSYLARIYSYSYKSNR
ncbi:MAG: glycosyltransferase family 2 protein [Candidatus Riflebacteria bacterium]|nr:glycosyltransferase family 2 protein [Candidatus Riflebacteria bacterium]